MSSVLAGYGSSMRLSCGICGATLEGKTTGPSERAALLESWNNAHAGCRIHAQDAALAFTSKKDGE